MAAQRRRVHCIGRTPRTAPPVPRRFAESCEKHGLEKAQRGVNKQGRRVLPRALRMCRVMPDVFTSD